MNHTLRRSLPIIALLFFFSWQSFGQVYTIGSASGNNQDSDPYPCPFGQLRKGGRNQFFYTASELIASGMKAGRIVSLGWKVAATNGAAATKNYTISIKQTSDTVAFARFDSTGFTQVYSAATYTPATGTNTFVFTTPFTWDGVSSIVIQTCYWAPSQTSASYNTNVTWTTGLKANSSRYYAADGSNGPFCDSLFTPSTSTTRPDIVFTRYSTCSGMPDAGTTVAKPKAVCAGSNDTLSYSTYPGIYDTGFVYQWQSSPDSINWTDIAGARSYRYITAPAVTGTGWYRLRDSCRASGLFSYSVPAYLYVYNGTTDAYCDPGPISCNNDRISKVVFQGISNATGCGNPAPAGNQNLFCSGGLGKVHNNETDTAFITIANSVIGGAVTEYMGVWLDYNRNGLFDSTEYTNAGSLTAAGTVKGLVKIPDTASGGYTGMRVRLTANTAMTSKDACTSYNLGEVEDYMILIVSPPKITPSDTNGCERTNLTLTASTGLYNPRYEWIRPNGNTFVGAAITLNNLSSADAGIYRVRVIAGQDTTGYRSYNVVVRPQPVINTISSNSPVCVGRTLMLMDSTTPSTGLSYSWTGPNGFTSSSQNPTKTNVAAADAGKYILTAFVGNCKAKDSTVVSVTAGPTMLMASSNSPLCTGDSLGLKASNTAGGVSYRWKGPNNFSSTDSVTKKLNVTQADSGIYWVIAGGGNCADSVAVSVVINERPAMLTTGSNSPLCAGDTLKLTSSSTTSNVTYSWTGPTGFTSTDQNPVRPNVAVADSGKYVLVATHNGCKSTDTVKVKVNDVPSNVLANGGAFCTGDTIFLKGSSNKATAYYTWTGPNNFVSHSKDTIITGAAAVHAGVYTLTAAVSATATCRNSDTALVTVSQGPTGVTATSNSPVCTADTLKLFANTSNSGYTFSWTGPNSFTSTDQNPVLPQPTTAAAGKYRLVTYNGGCARKDSTTVVINASPTNVTASSNSPICEGDTLKLTSGSATTTGVTYSWTGPNGFVSRAKDTIIANTTAANAGNYHYTITANGCSVSRDVAVQINTKPSGVTATSNSPVCTADTLKLFANTSNTTYTFTWTGPNNFNSTDQNPVLPQPTAAAAGKYRLVTSNGTCFRKDSTTVVINASPANVTASYNNPVCEGDTLRLTASSTTTTGVTYSWTGPNGFTSHAKDTIIAHTTQANAGSYRFTITANGCSVSRDVAVLIGTPPQGVTAGNNGPVCAGRPLSLTAATTATGATFSWSGPNGYSSTQQNPTINPTSYADSGRYVLTVKLNGCSAKDSTLAIVHNGPVVSATVTPLVCIGDSIKLRGMTTVPGTVSWTGPNGYSSTSLSSNITPAALANSGTYVLKVTANNCTDSISKTVTVTPPPSGLTVGSNSPVCEGATLQLSASATPSTVSYAWSGPHGYKDSTQSPVVFPVQLADSGIYRVIAYSGSCFVRDSVRVRVNPTPANLRLSYGMPLCAGDTLRLRDSTTSAGVTVAWSGPRGFASSAHNPIRPNVRVSDSGFYRVTATLGTCSVSDSIRVQVGTPPVVRLGNDTSFCGPGTVRLDAAVTAASYLWSTGDTTESIGVSMSGTYSVTAISTLGCAGRDTVQVNIFHTPSVHLGNDTTVCRNQALVLNAGNPGNHYSWSTADTTQSIVVSNPGTYRVTVRDGICYSRDTIVITAGLTPVVNLGRDTALCPGATLELNASNAGSTYSWNTGETSQTITVFHQGTYSVAVTSTDRCTARDTVFVRTGRIPAVNLGRDTSVCFNGSYMLDAGNGVRYSWNTGEQTQAIRPTATGYYFVTVTNTDGCNGSDTAFIDFVGLPHVDSIGYLSAGGVYNFNMVNPQNVVRQIWYLGDGSVDTSTNPAHTYTANGLYPVKLVVFGACGQDTVVRNINYGYTSVGNDLVRSQLRVFPNPASEFLTVDCGTRLRLRSIALLNAMGQIVYRDAAPASSAVQIPVQQLPAGIYTVQAVTDTGSASFRVQVSTH